MYIIYGIKNCNTMKKAFTWLDEHQINYQFHNYKTDGLSAELLNDLLKLVDWQSLLNTRGTTWRKLDEALRDQIDNQDAAIKIMLANPSILKRPLLIDGKQALLGFSEESYSQFVKPQQ
ncbi:MULTISPECIES: ArsC family reductase [Gilliamella]|uniref:ArsC family reductase n=2 Tax=Gilliamella TaxID=1193503 RepID=A0A2V4DNZ8_9GAMM|nr:MULTISPECIES: ArsC family reductase [Gilliamella]MBI0037958.1 ArsC family reductase [Gilliamella sp. B14384G10]MBI0039953.1 ArsC family reductase [Gilliamella sp. B14384G7]MBI0051793.1 ArsC family reductase [Gilliamella sp. B14384G13]MBI0054245.1 ArsC family reductase [Gilliamella sp. B14384H2]PXY90334.1 ArsC family reductase [Gilliamella apis]